MIAAGLPLAEAMRPARIEDVVGQSHLLGSGKPLRAALDARRPHSMIFWGPPGVGKTTLARLLAQAFDCRFVAISAVLAGVKEIREAVEVARIERETAQRGTIVFVDEVHRFNKAQQDAFLPHVESGLFTFVGATTENPSFEVNNALLSRAAVYVLRRLDDADLRTLITRASERCLGGLEVEDEAATLLVESADGDGRRLLNNLELAATAAGALDRDAPEPAADAAPPRLAATHVAQVLAERVRQFDKGGDAFYDQISALHKSVRGSHPNASLYWLVRMFDGGADPRYLARRVVRMAIEDVGLADPRALRLALDAAEVYERLGSPEGELAIAQAVLYLACAAKSNAGYAAYNEARDFVKRDASRAVPVHLRNAPTKLMKGLGFGREYRYAHDEPDGYAAGERYMPDGMDEPEWYRPVPRGLEIRIAEKLVWLRGLDAKARGQG
ncbi:MAG: replication-associated recombination protein A [Burkholderiaceae bacterium]|jgi:putative ATPase|nr:replication-associated recombination protein A [Burkholderiaceae bacterium]